MSDLEQFSNIEEKQPSIYNNPMVIVASVIVIALAFVILLPKFAPQPSAVVNTDATTQPNTSQEPNTQKKIKENNEINKAQQQQAINNIEQSKLREQAQKLLEGILEGQQQLKQAMAEQWANEIFIRASAALQLGDEAYAKGQFDNSIKHYQQARQSIQALLQQLPQKLQHFLTTGAQYIENEQQKHAIEAYTFAVAIDPNHVAAQRGLNRAQFLDKILLHYYQAQDVEQNTPPKLEEAKREYQAVLTLDAFYLPAQQGLKKMSAKIRQQQLQKHLSAGYQHLADGKYNQAQKAFTKALKIEPQNTSAQQGITLVKKSKKESTEANRLQQALVMEQNEQWSQALSLYQSVLQTNPYQNQMLKKMPYIKQRNHLDAQLHELIDKPFLLSVPRRQQQAKQLLQQGEQVLQQHPNSKKLSQQIALINELLLWSKQNFVMNLTSDGNTQIEMRQQGFPQQQLSSFTTKALQLKPGKYTFIGSRKGYKDVRKSVVIKNPKHPLQLNIICNESIY